MMYLKFRWGLSYEEVETEVHEWLPWRNFCYLSLRDPVPDATKRIMLNERFGNERIALVNKELVKQLVKTTVIKPRRITIDSTTLESHISYPTDVGLIHQVVTTLTRTAGKPGAKITSLVRSTKKAVARLGGSLEANKKTRKAQAIKALRSISVLAKDTVEQSRTVLKQIRCPSSGAQAKLKKTFAEQIALAEKILQQTEEKLAGVSSIEERIVSFYDPEARVIRKRKLNKPNEFGRTMELVQDSSRIILQDQVQEGNPSDKMEPLPTVKRFIRDYHRAPTDVAADKSYYSAQNITDLQALGVRRIGIPKIGRLRPDEKERQRKRWFKLLYRFRCAIEAAISMLKLQFSLGRMRSRGSTPTRIWAGFAIFSYNLWQTA